MEKELIVRPIQDKEREPWDQLMAAHHYYRDTKSSFTLFTKGSVQIAGLKTAIFYPLNIVKPFKRISFCFSKLNMENVNFDARIYVSGYYLSLKHLVGESIRYVALFNGQWVALLGWTSAACQPRPPGPVDRLGQRHPPQAPEVFGQ